jgi:hypothetical protein
MREANQTMRALTILHHPSLEIPRVSFERYSPKCRLANAWPEPDFKQASNCCASSRVSKAASNLSFHGINLAVCGHLPALCSESRCLRSVVCPQANRFGTGNALENVGVADVPTPLWPAIRSSERRIIQASAAKAMEGTILRSKHPLVSSERRMVEAAGIEPASLANIPAATTCLAGRKFQPLDNLPTRIQ